MQAGTGLQQLLFFFVQDVCFRRLWDWRTRTISFRVNTRIFREQNREPGTIHVFTDRSKSDKSEVPAAYYKPIDLSQTNISRDNASSFWQKHKPF